MLSLVARRFFKKKRDFKDPVGSADRDFGVIHQKSMSMFAIITGAGVSSIQRKKIKYVRRSESSPEV